MDPENAETTEDQVEDTIQADGEVGNEEAKTEEELEQELKDTQISIPRYSPHTVPKWDVEGMRERWKWHLRLYPIDQEDCRNCILDAATKIAQESWYYVPKRKNGQGTAELCMQTDNEMNLVMSRVVRMPFYHRYVTIEIAKKEQEGGGEDQENVPFTKVAETAVVVFDSTKCEIIKNTASSRGSFKRRNLWVRYVSEDTSKEMLHVLFPLSQNAQVQTIDDLRIGCVEVNSKTDVLLFMKSYLTLNINGQHVLALQNKEPSGEEGSELNNKDELESSVTAFGDLEEAPVEVADRSEQRKEDKNQTSRVLKRTLHQQQKTLEARRRDNSGGGRRGGRGEPPAKRGGGWGDRFDRRGGGGGARYGGGMPGGYNGPRGRGFGMDPQDMADQMMMMQAQLNQNLNQLMMMNPGGGHGGYGGGRYGGGGGGGGRRGGGRGGGRKGYGGGW